MEDVQTIKAMQFYKEPEVSWSRWFLEACYDDGSATELGKYLQEQLQGGTFIDVPCGLEVGPNTEDIAILPIVTQLGITTYIEVDNDVQTLGTRLQQSPRIEHDCTVYTLCADILEYLSTRDTTTSNGVQTIYISGLQPDQEAIKDAQYQKKVAMPYLQAVYYELHRVSRIDDIIILNEAQTLISGINEVLYPAIDPIIALTTLGFTQKYQCKYGKVKVLQKVQ